MKDRTRLIAKLFRGFGDVSRLGVLACLRDGDVSIPAGRIQRDHALVLADRAAAGRVVG